jgi:glycosyltransferase involved in cell wall biosynthesis
MFHFLQKNLADFQKSGWLAIQIKVENRLKLPLLKKKAQEIQGLQQKKILIINGAEKTVSEVHRVFHLQEKLDYLGIPSFVLTRNQLNLFSPGDLQNFDLLFIHRSRASDHLMKLIDLFQASKKPVFYDIDDLVFDQEIVGQLAFLKRATPEFRQAFLQEMSETLDIMKKSDLIITPTQFLSDYIKKKYALATEVLHNHLDQDSLNIGKQIFAEKLPSNKVTLAYFPGTRTHEKDFDSIERVLLDLLKRYPQLYLKIVGHLQLNQKFSPYQARISQQKAVPYRKFMQTFRGVDINVAPLEYGSDFCEAKSELKFIFAAAAAIPSVVTDTAANRFAIQQGKNGFLCKNSKDWQEALSSLIQDKKLRAEMGKAAYDFCYKVYTPEFQAKELAKILKKYANF